MIYIVNISVIFLFMVINSSLKKKYDTMPVKFSWESKSINKTLYTGDLLSEGIIERCMFAIALVMIILTAALRYDVGMDYMNYMHLFDIFTNCQDTIKDARSLYAVSEISGVEVSYGLWSIIAVNMGIKATTFIGFVSVVTLVLIGLVINFNSDNPLFSLFVFYILYFLQLINVSRQYLAVSIAFCAMPLLKKNKYIGYFLVVLLAATFHTSALVCLIYPVIKKIKMNYYVLIFYTMCGVMKFLPVALLKKVLGETGIYAHLIDSTKSLKLISILPWLVLIVVIYMHLNEMLKNPENSFYIHCIMIAFVLSLMSLDMFYLQRMICYFGVYVALFIPTLIDCIDGYREKVIIFLGYLMLMLLVFYNNAVDEVNNYLPYQTIYSSQNTSR